MPRRVRVFASHNWGPNGAVHARVRMVVHELRRHDIDVWFDETHMRGNILDAMCSGIEQSDLVLVFITGEYVKKVASGNENDNVRREFMYAQRTPKKLVAIRFDTTDPASWTGPVAMVLGSHLYVDMTSLTTSCDALVRTIRTKVARARPWSWAVHETLRQTKAVDALLVVHGTQAPRHDCKPFRPRLAAVRAAIGDKETQGEHTSVVVRRLGESFLTNPPGSSEPLIATLCRLEATLGIC